MKVSTAAVLLSISSASAFNVGYLNQLGGASSPAKMAPPVKQVVSGGPASYLDNLKGATPELVSAFEAAPVAPAPVAPAPVAYTPPPVAAVAGSAPNSAGYLSALSSNTSVSGGGLTGYLDALPSAGSQTSGAGISSYLDSVTSGVSPAVSAPAPVFAPPAVPSAPVVSAPAAGDYLGTLNTGVSVSGAGLVNHVDTLTSNSASGTGAAMSGYLSALGSNAIASGAGFTGYTDALQTTSTISGSSGSSAVASFLQNVYSQIMALPADAKTVSGSSVSFSASSGNMAMSFTKQ